MGGYRNEVSKHVRKAQAQGWRLEETKKGFMLYPPDKALTPVLGHWTPSDQRALNNWLSDLKRRGYDPTK